MVLGSIVPIVVAALLVGVRDTVQNANVALVLVVVVVVAAAVGGRWAGVCAAGVSALSFNFFHTMPYLRLTIDTADDVETTVLLLVVGLLVGNVTAGGWRARASAETSSSDIWRIHRVAERAARGEEAADVILAAQDEVVDLLGLRHEMLDASDLEDGVVAGPVDDDVDLAADLTVNVDYEARVHAKRGRNEATEEAS